MKRSLILFVVLFPIFGLAALLHAARLQASPPQSGGVTFTVNSTIDATDVNPGDGVCETAVGNGECTLRAAVMETNVLTGTDTILLPEGIYTITNPLPGDDELVGDFDIRDSLIISGAGPDNTIIDGNDIDSVFHISTFVAYEKQIKFSDLTIKNGRSLGDGGGIRNYYASLTLNNVGVIRNSAGGVGGGLFHQGPGTLTIVNSIFSENNAIFDGGGISIVNARVSIVDSMIGFNQGGDGGGIRIRRNGQVSTTLSITNSIIHNNIATMASGVWLGGGGVAIWGADFMIVKSIVRDNLATNSYGGGVLIYGGTGIITGTTIYNNDSPYNAGGGGISNAGNTVLLNSTVSGNGTLENGFGGGIYNAATSSSAFGIITLTNSTVVANSVADSNASGGGIYAEPGSTVVIKNSLIANNNAVTGPDCNGETITSLGYNLIGNTTDCTIGGDPTGNITNVNPMIGPLQDNGGNTWTHALLDGSPAIDVGNNAACPATDQRGGLRPFDGDGDNDPVCDIGAYEFGALQLTAVPDTITTTQNTPVLIDVLANDIPGDNGDPSLDSVSEPGNGTAVITNSLVLYTPDLDFTGTDTFTYTITDGVVTDTAVVTVTVLPLVGPTAVDDTAETNQNEPVLIDVLANDVPGSSGAPVLESVGAPMSGTAVITDTFILYTPAPDFFGTDTFTYTITDGVLTDTAVVTVTVLPVDDQTYIYLPVVLKPEE